MGGTDRMWSPSFGSSILITSAPRLHKGCVQTGPGRGGVRPRWVFPEGAAGRRDGTPPLWYQGSREPDDPTPGHSLSCLGNREVENLLIPRGTWSAWIRSMREAVIVGAVRTPIGKRGGALKDWRPDDLAAFALRALVDRAGIEPKLVEDVVLGCVTQVDEQGLNIGRLAPLIAGFPESVPGTSVNRMCASGLQAFNFASMEIMTHQADVAIAGGVESMSRVPLGSDAGALSPKLLEKYEIVQQGISADLVADKYHVTREQMDEFSLWSHRKAIRAIDEGRFKREIEPVPVFDENGQKRLFDTDEHPRRTTSLEKLASLPAAFKAER